MCFSSRFENENELIFSSELKNTNRLKVKTKYTHEVSQPDSTCAQPSLNIYKETPPGSPWNSISTKGRGTKVDGNKIGGNH